MTRYKQKTSFGAAEFKIVCEPHSVSLVIHNNHVVAKAKKDVYNKLFKYAVKQLGGRKDKKWLKINAYKDLVSLYLSNPQEGIKFLTTFRKKAWSDPKISLDKTIEADKVLKILKHLKKIGYREKG